MSRKNKKTGEPGIEILVSGKIIENEADRPEQFLPRECDERERKAAIGSLGFEFAQGGIAVPVAVEVLPLRARNLREARFENRVVLQVVDSHFPYRVELNPRESILVPGIR